MVPFHSKTKGEKVSIFVCIPNLDNKVKMNNNQNNK